jgi:hypothetical protein
MDCSSLLSSKGQVECSRNSSDHMTELQISLRGPSIEACGAALETLAIATRYQAIHPNVFALVGGVTQQAGAARQTLALPIPVG